MIESHDGVGHFHEHYQLVSLEDEIAWVSVRFGGIGCYCRPTFLANWLTKAASTRCNFRAILIAGNFNFIGQKLHVQLSAN